ncbi:alpha/beta hydrolase [Nocardia sp. NPDC050712]|uniref:alpha/beta fold hydrolase n=1 Tax=Nocardia sp. NPDC050712 TaxID=3155518 RepID=UPI0033D61CA5
MTRAPAALEQWHDSGATIEVTVRGVTRRVFVRVSGSGPTLLLLHGFPASSFEWAAIEPALAQRHTVVAVDFLGYGATEKPPGHRYSVFEQADLVEALLAELRLAEPTLVAYDYGAIVATELLARAVPLTRCVFLNGGLSARLYRPRPMQRLTLAPGIGRLLALALTERLFIRTWGEVFSPAHPLDPTVAAQHYRALRAGTRERDIHRRLLRYIPERAANRERLETALATTEVPLSFLWGMRDPVSGAAIATELRRSRPGIDLVEYAEVGHCPHLEIPDRVAADIAVRVSPSQS